MSVVCVHHLCRWTTKWYRRRATCFARWPTSTTRSTVSRAWSITTHATTTTWPPTHVPVPGTTLTRSPLWLRCDRSVLSDGGAVRSVMQCSAMNERLVSYFTVALYNGRLAWYNVVLTARSLQRDCCEVLWRHQSTILRSSDTWV